jgi:orotate phosphoribosyltransferase
VSKSEAEAILELAKRKGALKFGEFTLSAGGVSSYYFDGRLITLDPEGAYRVASAIVPILKECDAEAIAGPTLGADPIVAAIAVVSHLQGHPISGLIVRKEAKEYGGARAIEGPLVPGARVAVVDDACTSGASLFHAIDAVEAAGCLVVKVIALLDRREGGSEELRRRGYDFVALLEADEAGQITPTVSP